MNEFKLIVAVGRDFMNYELLSRTLFAMADVEFADKHISIVSGMAGGADALGVRFAKQNGVKLYEFPAKWDDLTAPGAVIKRNARGFYNANAGFARNHAMGRFADGLLAFWDGKSRGTQDMITYMRGLHKPVTVVNY